MFSSMLTAVYPIIPDPIGDVVYLPFRVGTEIVVFVFRLIAPATFGG